jgi:hypothetical protein
MTMMICCCCCCEEEEEKGGLRRQEYAAWAVDSKAISWSFVQERGGFIYKSALFFFPQLHDRSPNVKRHATQ